ncbi:murein hydrolase activator EnvC family protein [Thermoactinomyces mirandus]|uniref:Peptidoglycan DD-metalloendopeptidase family protein n=1 Tax=Thermoactinomyces mirandus TaxID=2756294 RepID=A0A7W1XUN5_9BACL|nr:M23 family metallopeptidase [Thermoactinomyces mirandus]MBA4603511.1 peptidoglycan DD-metalloendopeptidase family protein [Thermoactinomyces mirandus]
MGKKFFCGMVSFLLVFSLVPYNSFAMTNSSAIDEKKEDIRERDQEILQLKKKKELARQDLQSILTEIEAVEKKLNQLDFRVYEFKKLVQAKKEEQKKIEKELEFLRQTCKNRLQSIYLKGNMFYLELLLESDSLGDFLKRYDYVSILAQADQRMIRRYTEKQKELSRLEKELEKSLVSLQNEKEKAQKVFDTLRNSYQAHEKEIASLDSDLAELEDENVTARKLLHNLVAKSESAARGMEQGNRVGTSVAARAGGSFQKPVDGQVTSPFGMRYHPIHREYRMHGGIDIAARMGTPIKAAASGKVIVSRPSIGYGYIVVIYHGNGISTLYAHMYAQTVKVDVGQQVSAGEVIAAVGSNGFSTGPHLHFEVHDNSKPVDPISFLP